jgi:DNA adenine methylase
MSNIRWSGEGRWIEPFLGSGVVLFNVNPKRALTADTNEHVIRFYQAVQSGQLDPYNLRSFLESEGKALEQRGEAHYYEIRQRFNKSHSPFDFLFLNRACFNGMMRFNSRGEFNVPFCRKPSRFSPTYITKICNQVAWTRKTMLGKDWQFVTQDWQKTLAEVEENDFVYLDPPYNNRHTDYFNQWGDEEADRLAEAVKQLKANFAYSTWKQNKYRVNAHLQRHFSTYTVMTEEHFYHLGATESLRNPMEEALVISGHCVPKTSEESLLHRTRQQLTFPF